MRCWIGKAKEKRLKDLFLWCEQNAKKNGELDIDIEDKKDIINNPKSKIIFFDDDIELRDTSYIFLQIPFIYSMGQVISKDYQIAKDLLKYNGYKPKQWLNIIITMSNIWIENIPKKD